MVNAPVPRDGRTGRCRLCDTSYDAFMDFGDMPLGNAFVRPGSERDAYRFRLAAGICPRCGMVQLLHQPEPKMMFHEDYAYFSSVSAGSREHFRQLAADVLRRIEHVSDPLAVEIGSNDGILLEHLAQRGVRHLGVEPSHNVAKVASRKGVRTSCEFFDEDLAARIVEEEGSASVVLAANVVCHVSDLRGLLAGVARILSPSGVFIFEEPYLGDILVKNAFDQIYDEHVYYFCVASLREPLAREGLEIVEVLPQPVHGGSMRYVVAHQGAYPVEASVEVQLEHEERLRLSDAETWDGFRTDVESNARELRALLEEVRGEGRRVVGYGATSKSTTVINYCGIGPDLIEFLSDTTPTKWGLMSPGARIPVRPYEDFVADYPDLALLFAWNHSVEIMAKEGGFSRAGGRWIRYIPHVEVVT